MIPQTTIDRIFEATDIYDVISGYVDLKKAGTSYQGQCPFHDEKTASFMVSPAKGIYKCFGCGKGGNAVNFLMEYKNLSYPEALKELGKKYGIEIKEKEADPKDEARIKHRQSLYKINEMVLRYWKKNLAKNKTAKEYAEARWDERTIDIENLGYAADSYNDLKEWGAKQGIKQSFLIDLGLLINNNGKVYDRFRNRVMIPIIDHHGHIHGFTGRDISGNQKAKYLNSPESEIYQKSNILYGINIAYKTIRDDDYFYLVEGQPDVIRLHSIDVNNTIAQSGTELSEPQINFLKRLTQNATLIGDSDKAGQASIKKNAEKLIQHGFTVQIIPMPEGEEKHDPDSFFTSAKQFEDYKKENIQDFILYYASQKIADAGKNKSMIKKAINNVTQMVACYDENEHEYYINELAKIKKPKKIWSDKLRATDQTNPIEKTTQKLEKNQNEEFEKYGFYIQKNCYYFIDRTGNPYMGSNFVLKPLFHIESVLNAKRLFEIKNVYNHTRIIELEQKDLITLARFKERVESIGNFIWMANETALTKLKSYLYEKTDSCVEIGQMGWQKDGFFAYSNGIFNGEFQEVDKYGIVTYNKKNFYIPAFSSIYEHEDTMFAFERRFVHQPGKISFHDWASQFIEVYGINGRIAIAFYIATLFRDVIFSKYKFFPILNLFGEKGAGKTECAISILQLFGKFEAGPNLNNTTIPAMSDHVAQMSNALAHLDEWRNDVDFEKVEFIKGLWNAIGRTRKNRDDWKKNETTRVDSGVVLTGQQMPTADIALFSRLVFLPFYKTEYTKDEKDLFNSFKAMEKQGLTHITNTILGYRSHIIKHYDDHYSKVSADLSEKISMVIEDRIFRNWVVILAAYSVIKEQLSLPFTYEEIIKQAARQIEAQNKETKSSNEVSTFWAVLQNCADEGMIKEFFDYRIEDVTELKTDRVSPNFDKPKRILIINHARVLPLYRKEGVKMRENILPRDTIQYYLENSKAFFGIKKSQNFKREEHDGYGGKKWKITKAMIFDYDKLDINLPSEVITGENLNEEIEESTVKPNDYIESKNENTEELPF